MTREEKEKALKMQLRDLIRQAVTPLRAVPSPPPSPRAMRIQVEHLDARRVVITLEHNEEP